MINARRFFSLCSRHAANVHGDDECPDNESDCGAAVGVNVGGYEALHYVYAGDVHRGRVGIRVLTARASARVRVAQSDGATYQHL